MGTKPVDRLERRQWLRIGGLGCLGLPLSTLLRQPHASAAVRPASFGRARSCLVLFLSGGPPQHETFDPKGDAPVEVRGPFRPIATRSAGTSVCELLPGIAKIADRLTIVRSMSTGINAHAASGSWMMSGYPHPAGNRDVPASPTDWPCLGAVVGSLAGDPRLPFSAATLPERLVNNPGVAWPCQTGGFMGPAWSPYLLECDPSQPNFRVDSWSLPDDVSSLRLSGRRELLTEFDRRLQRAAATELESYDLASRQAFGLLTAGPVSAALDLGRESAELRDRYGRQKFGQSVLLARRLIEAGVRLVQVNYPREPGDLAIGNPLWDTHADNAGRAKNVLCPSLDQALSTLIVDLEARRLLDETLVVVMGEFGRSPKINRIGGRDHWGACFSVALAGAGLQPGVFGSSDRLGGEPTTAPVHPDQLAATIFHLLGIDPAGEFLDRQQRPRRISTGKPLVELL
ncbi:MAG TPA: DUF1501 domain-containing protein [Pirellulales bacterium]|jgi:hypothetical protein|nr:DUF1501 domain-containing protein [Pirellulales bacterium]